MDCVDYIILNYICSTNDFQANNERADAVRDPENDLNSWLPITASRKAKWWYSAFHNVTAMVGAGVLGLPFALSQLGWYYLSKSIHIVQGIRSI